MRNDFTASWCVKNKKPRNDLDMQADNNLPQNGIESLLKASAITNKFME